MQALTSPAHGFVSSKSDASILLAQPQFVVHFPQMQALASFFPL
jgi:hypothetical protein